MYIDLWGLSKGLIELSYITRSVNLHWIMETDMFSQLCDYMSEVGDLASIPVYVKM